ncbi:MAG TPA: histone deacetylase family protein, partial [Rudaea sp.]|nr:histone deacetylase family protein [Rudaea sp.]
MLLYTHPACLAHEPGPGHPESPSRLQAVLEALDTDRFAALDAIEAPR